MFMWNPATWTQTHTNDCWKTIVIQIKFAHYPYHCIFLLNLLLVALLSTCTFAKKCQMAHSSRRDQNPVVPRLGTGNPLNHFVGRHLGSMLQSNCCGHIGAAGISLTWHVLLLWPSSLLLIKHPSVLWNLFFCWSSRPNQIAKTRQSRHKTHTYRMESLW